MDSEPKNRFAIVLIGLLLLVGLMLRWWNLGGESLWFDEAYTAWVAGLPVAQLIEVVRVDNAPPLYYLLMRGWTRVFGDSEWALRAMSALAGSVALLLTPWIAHRLWRDRGGTVAATALAAVSFLPIRYAHEARTYELLSLAALLGIWALQHWQESRRVWPAVGFTLCLSAMTWMHNMAWLYVTSFVVAVVLWPSQRPMRLRLLDAGGVAAGVVALFAPWIMTLAAQVEKMGSGFWIATPDLHSLYYAKLLTAGVKLLPIGYLLRESSGSLQPGLSVIQYLLSAAVLSLTLCLVLARGGGSERRKREAIAVAALLPIVMAFVVSRFTTSVFTPKAFVPTAMLLPLLLAATTTAVSARLRAIPWSALVILITFSATSVLGHFRHERKEDWPAVHAYLLQHSTDDTLLVFVGNDGELGLRYYETRRGNIPGRRLGLPGNFFDQQPPRAMQRVEDDSLEALRASIGGATGEIILIGCHLSWADPNGAVRPLLQQHAPAVESRNFSGVIVERYGG